MSDLDESGRVDKLSDQWQTPQYLFEELDKKFNFDIDLCAIMNITEKLSG